MSADETEWDQLIAGLRKGDNDAVAEFCRLFADRLERLADRHLASGLKRRVGADDVVQSVCRTFVRRTQKGEFEISEADSLWALLCAITLTKVREQARYHLRQKRSLNRENNLDSIMPDGRARRELIPGASPDPAGDVEFEDNLEQIVARFTDEERQLIDLKLQQHTNEEIAERLECSERTVRRLLKRVQTRLESEFQDSVD